MKILVLSGGISSERDVSLTTGALVTEALRGLGHQAAALDLFLGLEQEITAAQFYASGGPGISGGIHQQAPDLDAIRAQRSDQSASHIGPRVLELAQAADIVFLALHGADGEDGKIQALFDLLAIKYTGSGSLPSAIAMDKHLSKLVFREHGLQLAADCLLHKGEQPPADLPLPAMVKPCCGGSSVGTALVETPAELAASLEAAFACDDRVLIEQYIAGRELQVAVLNQHALPPIELQYDGKFFDYVAKYQPGACREICPAPITAELDARLRAAALLAHNALGLSVYSRVDFIVTADDKIYLLEINTLPGMTATSLVPQEAAAEGISYPQLCQMIIDISLARYAD